MVELPGHQYGPNGRDGHEADDVEPRAKLENIGMEYTHLLTSQLESQRVYFEEMLSINEVQKQLEAGDLETIADFLHQSGELPTTMLRQGITIEEDMYVNHLYLTCLSNTYLDAPSRLF